MLKRASAKPRALGLEMGIGSQNHARHRVERNQKLELFYEAERQDTVGTGSSVAGVSAA